MKILKNSNQIINERLVSHAKDLRNNSTLPEVLFWKEIRNRKIGYKFIRQKIIGRYIVDFYCAELNLVVEIDGRDHEFKEEYDTIREDDLIKMGLKIIRFSNHEIYNLLNECIENLREYIKRI